MKGKAELKKELKKIYINSISDLVVSFTNHEVAEDEMNDVFKLFIDVISTKSVCGELYESFSKQIEYDLTKKEFTEMIQDLCKEAKERLN